MYNVNFLGLTSKQNSHKAETAGVIAHNSKPQLFRPAETAGTIASSTPSMGGSTPSGCGSSCNAVA